MRILHIEDRIHPEMGYQVNFFARFHNPEDEFFILTTDSFSLWKVSDPQRLMQVADKEFESTHAIRLIRNKAGFDRKGKINLWIKGLHQSINEIKPDVIFTHGIETFTTWRIILCKKYLKNYLVLTDTHTLYNQFTSKPVFRFYLFLLKTFIIRRINRFSIPVFYTTWENETILKKEYSVNPDHIFPCHIGTDFNTYHFSETARQTVRKELGIAENQLAAIYCGKFDNKKQPHLILEAVGKAAGKLSEKLHLVFIGPRDETYMATRFKPLMAIEGIKIHIIDSLPAAELYKYYSAGDFGVFPKENTLSSLDAQACKLPLIMEDDFTNTRRLEKGGLLYKPGDTNDLSAQVLKLSNDHHLRQKLSEEGYDFIKKNFDYSKIVSDMEAVIRKIFRERNFIFRSKIND